MRLLMFFYDRIYLEAFLKASARHQKDLCLEVIETAEDFVHLMESVKEGNTGILRDTLLLTDHSPDDFTRPIRELLKDRIVCLTEYPEEPLEHTGGIKQIFRYQRFSKILADLKLCMNDLSGKPLLKNSRTIAVISDGSLRADALYDSYSEFLLKQLAANEDLKVLVFDLRAFRREPGIDSQDYDDENRLMMARYYYDAVAQKKRDIEGFYIQDEASIYHFRGGYGLTSFLELSEEERTEVLQSMESGPFHFVLYDIGAELTRENLSIVRHVDILIMVTQNQDFEYLLQSELSFAKEKWRPTLLITPVFDLEESMLHCAEEHMKIIMDQES